LFINQFGNSQRNQFGQRLNNAGSLFWSSLLRSVQLANTGEGALNSASLPVL